MRNITRLCETKSVITVNGKFPGPRIIAREGDRVVIKVVNHVPNNITIHWYICILVYIVSNLFIIGVALILSVSRVGMEFGNFKVGGLMGRHTSHNARFKRVDHTFTTLPLRAKLEHYGIMPMFHGLGLPYMARSSFSLNIMNHTRLSNPTRKSRSYLVNYLNKVFCFAMYYIQSYEITDVLMLSLYNRRMVEG